MKMTAVILDDEVRGSKLLQQKLSAYTNQLEVVAIYNDPLEALANIREVNPDVLFLDVEMPELDGFQFLEKLGSISFEVIFVTAYNSYTLNALRINALDYLLKPVADDELAAAVKRLTTQLSQKQALKANPARRLPYNNKVALSTAEGVYLIKKEDIIRVEAMSNYSVFFLTENKKIMVSKTLKEFEAVLDDIFFLRVNRSAIINLEYVTKYRKGEGGTLELSDGSEIEVSASRKESVLERLFD